MRVHGNIVLGVRGNACIPFSWAQGVLSCCSKSSARSITVSISQRSGAAFGNRRVIVSQMTSASSTPCSDLGGSSLPCIAVSVNDALPLDIRGFRLLASPSATWWIFHQDRRDKSGLWASDFTFFVDGKLTDGRCQEANNVGSRWTMHAFAIRIFWIVWIKMRHRTLLLN